MRSQLMVLLLELFREPSLFLSLIVLAGLLFQHEPVHKIIESVVKTIVGVRILQTGTIILVEASKPAINAIVARFNFGGRIADPWLGVGESLERLSGTPLAGQIGLILILGWVLHLLLSRFMRLKVVYLTMHVAFVDTVLVTFFVHSLTGWQDFRAVLIVVILLAVYWWFWPALLIKPVSYLTRGEQITIGHQLVVGSWMVIGLAKLFGSPPSSSDNEQTEENQPGWFQILKDPVISYSLIMGLIYSAIGLLAGGIIGSDLSGEKHHVLFFFLQGMAVAAGVTILLAGVKMMLAELLPAFEVISNKVIPGAVPALDLPVFWPYAPRGALLGLVFTFLGMLAGLVLQIIFKSEILTIPSVLPVFFGGSTLGVLAFRFGGTRGAAIAVFLAGIVQVFGSVWLAKLVGFNLAGGGNIDYCLYWPALIQLAKGIQNLF